MLDLDLLHALLQKQPQMVRSLVPSLRRVQQAGEAVRGMVDRVATHGAEAAGWLATTLGLDAWMRADTGTLPEGAAIGQVEGGIGSAANRRHADGRDGSVVDHL